MDCLTKGGDKTRGACRQAHAAIIDYCAGRLTPEDKSVLREHLKVCAACKDTAQAQNEVWSALDVWVPPAVAGDFDARLYAKIDAYQRQSWWRRTLESLSGTWSFTPAMPIAVACSVLVAAFLLNSSLPKHSPPTSVPQSSEIKIDVQQIERALDDLDMITQLRGASPQAASEPLRSQAL